MRLTNEKSVPLGACALAATVCFFAASTLFCVSARSTGENADSTEAVTIPLRTGIWVLQRAPANDAQLRRFERGIRENAWVSGVMLHAYWNEVEKEPGEYDFERFDRAIATLRSVGMKYKLAVKPGTKTPQFVYDQGAQTFESVVTNPHRANHGATVKFPLPWDPTYQDHYSRLVRTLGERYSLDPLCVSVALSGANYMSAEMHLPKGPRDMERWRSFGDYKEKLLAVYIKYMDEWANAFPQQEICLHVSPVLHLPPSELVEKIIEYGLSRYPQRFVIQTCTLTGRREDAGKETYDLIMKYKARVHHGFQSLSSFLTQPERMGTTEMAILNQVQADGQYWELWQGDGMNVDLSREIGMAWEEAKKMGYDAYKADLVAKGLYRKVADDTYQRKAK